MTDDIVVLPNGSLRPNNVRITADTFQYPSATYSKYRPRSFRRPDPALDVAGQSLSSHSEWKVVDTLARRAVLNAVKEFDNLPDKIEYAPDPTRVEFTEDPEEVARREAREEEHRRLQMDLLATTESLEKINHEVEEVMRQVAAEGEVTQQGALDIKFDRLHQRAVMEQRREEMRTVLEHLETTGVQREHTLGSLRAWFGVLRAQNWEGADDDKRALEDLLDRTDVADEMFQDMATNARETMKRQMLQMQHTREMLSVDQLSELKEGLFLSKDAISDLQREVQSSKQQLASMKGILAAARHESHEFRRKADDLQQRVDEMSVEIKMSAQVYKRDLEAAVAEKDKQLNQLLTQLRDEKASSQEIFKKNEEFQKELEHLVEELKKELESSQRRERESTQDNRMEVLQLEEQAKRDLANAKRTAAVDRETALRLRQQLDEARLELEEATKDTSLAHARDLATRDEELEDIMRAHLTAQRRLESKMRALVNRIRQLTSVEDLKALQGVVSEDGDFPGADEAPVGMDVEAAAAAAAREHRMQNEIDSLCAALVDERARTEHLRGGLIPAPELDLDGIVARATRMTSGEVEGSIPIDELLQGMSVERAQTIVAKLRVRTSTTLDDMDMDQIKNVVDKLEALAVSYMADWLVVKTHNSKLRQRVQKMEDDLAALRDQMSDGDRSDDEDRTDAARKARDARREKQRAKRFDVVEVTNDNEIAVVTLAHTMHGLHTQRPWDAAKRLAYTKLLRQLLLAASAPKRSGSDELQQSTIHMRRASVFGEDSTSGTRLRQLEAMVMERKRQAQEIEKMARLRGVHPTSIVYTDLLSEQNAKTPEAVSRRNSLAPPGSQRRKSQGSLFNGSVTALASSLRSRGSGNKLDEDRSSSVSLADPRNSNVSLGHSSAMSESFGCCEDSDERSACDASGAGGMRGGESTLEESAILSEHVVEHAARRRSVAFAPTTRPQTGASRRGSKPAVDRRPSTSGSSSRRDRVDRGAYVPDDDQAQRASEPVGHFRPASSRHDSVVMKELCVEQEGALRRFQTALKDLHHSVRTFCQKAQSVITKEGAVGTGVIPRDETPTKETADIRHPDLLAAEDHRLLESMVALIARTLQLRARADEATPAAAAERLRMLHEMRAQTMRLMAAQQRLLQLASNNSEDDRRKRQLELKATATQALERQLLKLKDEEQDLHRERGQMKISLEGEKDKQRVLQQRLDDAEAKLEAIKAQQETSKTEMLFEKFAAHKRMAETENRYQAEVMAMYRRGQSLSPLKTRPSTASPQPQPGSPSARRPSTGPTKATTRPGTSGGTPCTPSPTARSQTPVEGEVRSRKFLTRRTDSRGSGLSIQATLVPRATLDSRGSVRSLGSPSMYRIAPDEFERRQRDDALVDDLSDS